MAKGITRRGRSLGPVSHQLDERFPISFRVLGRSDWLQRRFVEGALRPEEQVVVSTSSDLAVAKQWLDVHPYHSGDTETDGLRPWREDTHVVLLQLGNPEMVWIIDPDLIEEFRPHLESKSFLHIWQNAVFDFKMLLGRKNIHMERLYCTMLAEQMLSSGRSGISVGLEDIARRRAPHRIISKEVRKLFYNLGERRFTRDMVYYAARDVALLEPVMLSQVQEIKRWDMQTAAQDEFNVIPVTAGMELWGLYLDEDTINLSLKYWKKEEARLERRIMEIYGERRAVAEDAVIFLAPGMREYFNIASNKDKIEALRQIGLTLDDAKRDTLELIDDPIAKLLVEYSYVTKITSTYGDSLIERIDKVQNGGDGRLHPRFRQLGAGDSEETGKGRDNKTSIATARYSSDFQQLPRGSKHFCLVDDPDELAEIRLVFADQLRQIQSQQGELIHA